MYKTDLTNVLVSVFKISSTGKRCIFCFQDFKYRQKMHFLFSRFQVQAKDAFSFPFPFWTTLTSRI